MFPRLALILSLGGITGAIYALAMCATPNKGIMRVIERVCGGVVLCWLCQTVLSPFGVQVAQSPLAAVSAGYWGLPGIALASVLAYWP